jgi:hypothetical protein
MMVLPYFVLAATRKALFSTKNEAVIGEEAFNPFDLSHLQYLPRENDRAAAKEARRFQVHAANRPAVQPPAVPFIDLNLENATSHGPV